MFALKNKYYLYIENTKDLNLNLIKKRHKFSVIYRNTSKQEDLSKIIRFRQECKRRGVSFYFANNIKLSVKSKADGIYVSAHNKDLQVLNLKRINIKIIGSAHNLREYSHKIKQGCEKIVISRLFKTDYKNKNNFIGIIKFNSMTLQLKKELIPLGGIRLHNLNSMRIIRSKSFAILSEIKKKPTISSRLF
jgi:thiamine monophosphate synthase